MPSSAAYPSGPRSHGGGVSLPALVPFSPGGRGHYSPGLSCYGNFLNGFFRQPSGVPSTHCAAACPRQLPLTPVHMTPVHMTKCNSEPTLGFSTSKTRRRSNTDFETRPPIREKRKGITQTVTPVAIQSHATQEKKRVLQREACESLRMLTFGRVGNETWPVNKKNLVFEQCRGTEAEIDKLCDLWFKMDANANGAISMQEFVDFFEAGGKSASKSLGMGARLGRYLTNAARARESALNSNSLKMQIHSARGLVDADHGTSQGGSDVYCICEVPGKPSTKITTRVINDTCTPVWNHRATIPDYTPGDPLSFTLWDYDIGKPDDFLGKVLVESTTFHPLGFNGELLLAEAGGEAYLKVKITPASAAPAKSTVVSEAAGQCTREDLMRLLWLNADDDDIAAMTHMFQSSSLRMLRAQSPMLLPQTQQDELVENFRYLDAKGKGEITYESLMHADLIDEEMMHELKGQYDKDGNGRLHMQEFVEMLCPCGYRPNTEARRILDTEGSQMSLISADFPSGGKFSGWFYDEKVRKLPIDVIEYVRWPGGHPVDVS